MADGNNSATTTIARSPAVSGREIIAGCISARRCISLRSCTYMSGTPRGLAGRAADRMVGKAVLLHARRIVEVAAVENHRLPHAALHFGEIWVAKFAPLGVDG